MEILNRLLEISVYSIVLFVAVIAIKKAFSDKMSPVLHFMIWFLLIARLCIPFTIDSGLNLIVIPAQTAIETTAVDAPASAQDNPFDFSPESQSKASIQNIRPWQSAEPDCATAKPDNLSNSLWIASMRWMDIFLAVWLVGIFIRGVWMAAVGLKIKRVIRRCGIKPNARIQALMGKCKAELGITRDIPVYLLPHIATPALTIGLRPKMVLPSDITKGLNEEQLMFAIKHELTHYKRKDNIVNLLLRALEAVYWFNPIVWLMGRYMIADMETACDSMVVKAFDQQEKKQYALMLLDLFSQRKAPRFMLGMTLNHTEKIAERRIRGVYMNDKSRRGVKMMAGILAVVLFVVCFTTACQPTPEEDVIVGKNNNNLDSIIGGTPAPAINTETMQQHETWQEQLSGNNVTINIDAGITFPQVVQFPVVEIAPIYFTEDDAWKIIQVFFKDNAVYYDEPLFTKEVLEAQIVTLKQMLSEIENGTMPDYEEGEEDQINDQIEYYTELLQTAPSEDDEPQAIDDLSFKKQYEGAEVISVSTNIGSNGSPATLRISRNESAYVSGIYFSNFPDTLTTTITTENNMEMTLDEAVSLVQSTMNDLGIGDMILAESSIEGSTQEQVYVLNYIKSINGIGVSSYQTHMMTQQEEGEDNVYAPFLAPEQVTIYINDAGILGFSLTNALEMGDVINENVKILSIDEVKDIFREQVFYNYYAFDNNLLTIDIERIELGYFVQSVKDQQGVFRAIPVWDFLASEQAYEGDTYTYSVLTINAIDGSIIDRGLGY